MAGGPIFPHSAFPVTSGNVFPNFHVGAGANSKQDEGLGVVASVGADSIWRLRFWMPPTLPTGTCKLRIWSLANAAAAAGWTAVTAAAGLWTSVALGTGATVWDGGATIWDGGATLWDLGLFYNAVPAASAVWTPVSGA